MSNDWIDDETLSGDDIRARFEQAGPSAPTVGPPIPAGGRINAPATTFSSAFSSVYARKSSVAVSTNKGHVAYSRGA